MAANVMTQVEIMVRAANPTDIPAIAALIEPFVEEGKLLERTFDEMNELLPNFFIAATVTEPDGTELIVGCAALEIYSRKLAEVRSLAVHPDYQGLGIGRMLVEACVERARERGIFEVMAITASEGFFKSCGFDFTLPGEKKALFIQTRDRL
jgi:N-acetylglutamate synthase-like GNAT family acetyltransferase